MIVVFSLCALRRQWHPTPVLLPGKSHGQRSLVGCSPWGRSELDMTEQLRFHFSPSCIGEGNGILGGEDFKETRGRKVDPQETEFHLHHHLLRPALLQKSHNHAL